MHRSHIIAFTEVDIVSCVHFWIINCAKFAFVHYELWK
jgi:hypothetical protein